MKKIDDWFIHEEMNKVFHLCKGDESKSHPNKKIIEAGMWPTKIIEEVEKCVVCNLEVPNQVKIYLTKII